MWVQGFLAVLSSFNNIAWLLVGTFWGLFIGILPVLGASFAVILLLPFTYRLETATAIILLCSAHAATNYGDSLTSILINVPGSPATVATCWDGYPMARKGQAGRALGIATLASFLGGAGAWLSLALMAKPMTETVAYSIGPPEYFALGLMALCLVSVAGKGETIKGIVMACLGLVLSCVGEDPLTGYNYRFSFGILWLEAGFPIVVTTLGIFAVAQIIRMLEEFTVSETSTGMKDSILSGFLDVIRRPLTFIRAGIVGWFVGILPALGTSVAGICSYLVEKSFSKEKDDFGKGSPAGVMAAEVGKGSCVVGDLIPTFMLGIPGSVTGALIMAGLILKGVEPGPRFLHSGLLPYTVFAGLLLGQLAYVLIGPMVCKLFVKIAFIPNAILAPLITVLAFLGVFTERNYGVDFFIMIGFGVMAYYVEKVGYSPVCLVLGLIIGPLVEANLGRSLEIALGSPLIFLHRPIAILFFLISIFFLFAPYIISLWKLPKIPLGEEEERPAVKERPVKLMEVLTLVFIGLVMVGVLVMSKNYSFEVRLFPTVVAAAGLLITVFRLISLALKAMKNKHLMVGPLNKTEPKAPSVMSTQVAISLMVGYAAIIFVFGFIISTIFFVAVTMFVARYRKPRVLVAVSVGAGIFAYAFGKFFSVLLPTGFFF